MKFYLPLIILSAPFTAIAQNYYQQDTHKFSGFQYDANSWEIRQGYGRENAQGHYDQTTIIMTPNGPAYRQETMDIPPWQQTPGDDW